MSEVKQVTQPKFLRVVATILSYILHPIFMPLYMLLALHWLAPVSFTGVPNKEYHRWIATVVLLTIFFPLLSLLLMKALGFVKSILMHDPKDRIIPLIATMIFYFWASHTFNSMETLPNYHIVVPIILKVLMLGAFWGVIVIFMLNIFFKVSMHTTAAGSMIGILIVLMLTSPVNMLIPFFIVLVIAGLMGTARMVLGAHKPGEIWAGYVLGLLVMLGAYWFI